MVPVDSIPTDCSSLCSSNVLNVKGQNVYIIPLRYKENKGGREVLLNCGLKILWSWEQLILFHVSSNPYPIFIMYWSQWSGIHWASPPIQTLRYQQNQDKGGKELESNPLKPAFLWCMHTALRPKQTNLTLRLIQSCIYENKNPTSTSLQCKQWCHLTAKLPQIGSYPNVLQAKNSIFLDVM